MEKQKKVQMGLQLSETCQNSAGFFLLGYKGLKVEESNEIRKKLRSVGARAWVVKNHVAQKALESLSIDMKDHLKGQTLFVFAQEDLVASAKVLRDYAKENEKIKIKGGFSEGQVFGAEKVLAFADLPSRDELYANLLRALSGPATQVVRTLQAVPESLARVVRALSSR